MAPSWADRAQSLLGSWGRPADEIAIAALALAIILAAVAATKSRALLPDFDDKRVSTRRFLLIVAFAAAFLSLLYVAEYLRGGPRIIDASTYYLQARAISEGHFAWQVPEPSASFRGRFLIAHEGHVAGIFPPGYPLLLALGFLMGMPMIIGPLLAASIVLPTYALAKEVAWHRPESESIARAAVLLSLACAALRYHTADTMSHGACALWVTASLAWALRAKRTSERRWLAYSGFALGMVIATRPVSALPIGACVLLISWRAHRLHAARVAVFALFGVGLLMLSQWASTGSALRSTQLDYYATSDGPPGCFRYGFGAGIGCMFEHGDFVRARLPDGYGLFAAAGTTLRRLSLHLSDALNAWPLTLFVLAISKSAVKRAPLTGWLVALVALQVLAYAPFYFDGNYPAGGARLYADVLPVEHVFVAVAVSTLSVSVSALTKATYVRRTTWMMALVLAGFAFHGVYDHRQLAERDGGRVMFDREDLDRAKIKRGLVFVDTDHGFDLAHDPKYASAPDVGVTVARLRGDDHDRLLYTWLEEPTSWVYRFGDGASTLTPYNPPGKAHAWTFEAEAEWPPEEQRGAAWAMPIWTVPACASGAHALEVQGDGEVVIALPVPEDGAWTVTPRVLVRHPIGSITVLGETWSFGGEGGGELCRDLDSRSITLVRGEERAVIRSYGDPIAVDAISLTRPR